MRNINAVLTIAYRDVTKLLRDRTRIVASLIFPVIFVGVLGSSLEANLGEAAGYSFLAFTFTGVLAQTLFQSTAAGIISLVEDKQNDFAQEMFIAPIPRYLIILGKIVGETAVAMVQGVAVLIFGFVIGVSMTPEQVILIVPTAVVAALVGGAFGVLVMANLEDQRLANQIFPFVLFPQFFLAGVFSPIKELPAPLLVASRLAPMTYPVDLLRGAFYAGKPEYDAVVLNSPIVNLIVIGAMFLVFLSVGTFLFIRNERNR